VVIGSEWPVVKVKRLADRVETEVLQRDLAGWMKQQLQSES
jgi:hypothetical protein